MSSTVTVNPARNLAAFKIGVIQFDGARHTTHDVSGDRFAYAEFTVPDPIPPEWMGKVSRIAAYAGGDGNGKDIYAFQWMSIEADVGVWGKPIGNRKCTQGLGVNLVVCFGQDHPYALRVDAGQRLFVNIQNRMPWYGSGSLDTPSSCGPGVQCDFTMDASIPG